jgi:hypothetical protein
MFTVLLPPGGYPIAVKYIIYHIINLRERDHLGDPGVDGRIILRWIWVELAQDRDRWLALVNAEMNLRGP